MRQRLSRLLVFLAVTHVLARVAPAQTPLGADSVSPPMQVMILGVFHFANPNADYARFEGVDVLTPARQSEIEQVVTQLARFRPTRIAIEQLPNQTDSINADYRRYLAGRFTLTRNEIHQLGFRLAARLHHEQLYPVDFPEGLSIDSVLAYAQLRDTAFAVRFQRTIADVVQRLDRLQREATIGENLRFMNDPATILQAHQPYADMATVGAQDGYVGARAVSRWYDRNLHIFANLAGIGHPGDRILLIIGQGHAPILRELVRSHAGMSLVEPLAYLR